MATPSERPPLVAALLLFLVVAVWATGLLMGATGLADPVGRTAGAGVWLIGIVALVGLLVSRGRWSQRVGVSLALALFVPAAYVDNQTFFWIGVGLAAVTGGALLLPPATEWIRPGRSADAPPDTSVVLMLVLLSWPFVGAAVAAGPVGWLIWAGPILAFWYSRAVLSGLWAVRVGGVLPLVAALGTGLSGWVTAVALTVATAAFAWRAETRLAVVPLTNRPSSGVCPTPDFEKLLRGFDDA